MINISIIIITAILYLIEPSYGLGWLYGWLFILIRRQLRYKYLNYVSNEKTFNIGLFILYTVLSFAIAVGTIYLSFMIQEWIHPVLVLVAYIVDYIMRSIERLSQSKKE